MYNMPHMADIEKKANNLGDWRLKLQKTDVLFGGHLFANQLHENTDPYATAAFLGLPIPEYRKPKSIASFVENSQPDLRPLINLGISNFYVGLRPLDNNLQKFRNEDPLTLEGIVPYIQGHIPPENYDKYSLRVAEYVIADCGMVIVVNPSGTIHVDMVMGDLGPLATGEINPEYKARTDRFTRVLRYTKADPIGTDNMTSEYDRAFQLPDDHPVITTDLRAAIDRGINRIPKIDDGISGKRIPGRYELAIVDHAGILVPIYVDAQPDEFGQHPYAIPEEPLY